MPVLVVVNTPANWPLNVPGVEVVSSRRYLTDPQFNALRDARVFNLCRSYGYQSLGYYVSLLAEARGHRPQPDVITIQDFKSTTLTRVITEDLGDLVQKTLRTVPGPAFTLSIYFGKTVAKRDKLLGQRLFGLFRAPLLRAQFVHRDRWHLHRILPIPASEIPVSHRPLVVEAAKEYFSRRYSSTRSKPLPRFDMAILHDPSAEDPPSNDAALAKFERAANRAGFGVDLITRHDFARVSEYDALFIRATTSVNHYTYRFARRAAAEGVVVIDDPLSIARCTNKVFLAERMRLNGVAVPPTVTVHRDNVELALEELGLPLVLKQPDSSFSRGVIKVESVDHYRSEIARLLDKSDLIVAQSFTPSDFDWRVGILDGQPLYVCKYFMARSHWQIMNWEAEEKDTYGRVTTLGVDDAPRAVVKTAVRAARLIGDGLYGVDLKEVGGKIFVIEVNDNPSIDAGYEDRILKDELYDVIMRSFIRRIEELRGGKGARVRKHQPESL